MKAALNQRCCSYVESSLTMHNRLIFCSLFFGETIRRKGGVSQGCLGKSTSFTLDIYNMVQGIVN